MDKIKLDSRLARLTTIVIGSILVIAPFYAPLTVLVASHLNHFDFWRIWKEIFLSLLGLTILSYLLIHWHKAKKFIGDKLILGCIAYGVFLLFIGLFDLITHRVAVPAIIYGLMIDLRQVGFFVLVYLAFKTHQLNKKFAWWKVVLIPAVIVVGFGFLQMTVLPKDVLSHMGYSKTTIVPFQTVDNQGDFVRIQSTLRGPNPLGAYLVLVISLIGGFILSGQKRPKRSLLLVFLGISLIVLFGTYSRSAWLGTMVAGAILILTSPHINPKLRRLFVVGIVGVAIIGVTLLLAFRNNYTFQTAVFHSSNRSAARDSSNFQRAGALEIAAKDVWGHPLGQGVGSAGPASLRNSGHPGKISENYFLQIGQEAGWVGLTAFITINLLLLKGLYDRRHTLLGNVLLASLGGLIVVNLLSHAWADDTLAYIWWGLAGIALAHGSPKPAHQQS